MGLLKAAQKRGLKKALRWARSLFMLKLFYATGTCALASHIALQEAGADYETARRGYRWVDADDTAAIAAMQKRVPQSVAECFDLIEREMFVGPWVMGDSYSICDPYLFTLAQWLEADGVNPLRFPKVQDHRKRMSERPGVKTALAQESPLSG